MSKDTRTFINYSSVTSTVAILLSLAALYFNFFREAHSLKVGVVDFDTSDTTLPVSLSCNVILLNNGNKTETLLSLDLFLSTEPGGKGGGVGPPEVKGPFVLKAGDVIPVRLKWDNLNEETFENEAKWEGSELYQKASFIVNLRVSAVRPDGTLTKRIIAVSRLEYDDASGMLTGTETTPDNWSLTELLAES